MNDSKVQEEIVAEQSPKSAVDPYDSNGGAAPTPFIRKILPFQFVASWRFWGILVLGQILSWCIVSTNTLTQYLSNAGAIIPAFQSLFNYALLAIVYLTWTVYKYGFRKMKHLLWKDGWKYICFAFFDVEGVFAIPVMKD